MQTNTRNSMDGTMQGENGKRGRAGWESACGTQAAAAGSFWKGRISRQAAVQLLAVFVLAVLLTVLYHVPALAAVVNPDADTSQFGQVTNGLNTLLSLFKIVVMIIGGIIVLKNGLELASAIQQQDSNGIKSGLMGMAGGGVALASAAILSLFQ